MLLYHYKLFFAILRYAILRYDMLRYAILRYGMLRYAVLCFAVLRYAMLSYASIRYAILRYAVLCFASLRFTLRVFVPLTFPQHVPHHGAPRPGSNGQRVGTHPVKDEPVPDGEFRQPAGLAHHVLGVVSRGTQHPGQVQLLWRRLTSEG